VLRLLESPVAKKLDWPLLERFLVELQQAQQALEVLI
jgi:hypothetical protein